MAAKSAKESRAERLEAFETVVATYQGPLLRYATRLAADADAAQDIVQDAFIRLLKKWREPMAPSPALSSWLYRVTHNCAVDHIRKISRRQDLHHRHAEREGEPVVPPDRGRAFAISDAAAAADAALKTLSLRERQLVVLKVYEEKSYREISEITDLSTGNVGYILHHAMKKLADTMRRNQS